jgi:hypothetical protein
METEVIRTHPISDSVAQQNASARESEEAFSWNRCENAQSIVSIEIADLAPTRS